MTHNEIVHGGTLTKMPKASFIMANVFVKVQKIRQSTLTVKLSLYFGPFAGQTVTFSIDWEQSGLEKKVIIVNSTALGTRCNYLRSESIKDFAIYSCDLNGTHPLRPAIDIDILV